VRHAENVNNERAPIMPNYTHRLEVYQQPCDRPSLSLCYLLIDYWPIEPVLGYTIAEQAAIIIDSMPVEQQMENTYRIVPLS
jgi:hypothetical protein